MKDCRECAKSRENGVFHGDCFRLFLSHVVDKKQSRLTRYEAIDRLFQAATWRLPWPQSGVLMLKGCTAASVSAEVVQSIFCEWIPTFSKLPPELLMLVIDNLVYSDVWRYIAVRSLAEEILKSKKDDPGRRMLLTQVSWTRSGGLNTSGTRDTASDDIMVMIDNKGVQSVLRHSNSLSLLSRDTLYATFKPQDANRVIAHLKVR